MCRLSRECMIIKLSSLGTCLRRNGRVEMDEEEETSRGRVASRVSRLATRSRRALEIQM